MVGTACTCTDTRYWCETNSLADTTRDRSVASLTDVAPHAHTPHPLYGQLMTAAGAPRASRDDTGAVVCETITLAVATVAEVLASGGMEAFADIQLVSSLCILLKHAKGVVDKAVLRQEEQEELHKLCGVISGQVMDKHYASSSGFDVSLLRECIEELNEMAEYCGHNRSVVGKRRSLKHGNRNQNLRERIHQLVPIMGLVAGVSLSNQLEVSLQMMVRVAKRSAALFQASHLIFTYSNINERPLNILNLNL